MYLSASVQLALLMKSAPNSVLAKKRVIPDRRLISACQAPRTWIGRVVGRIELDRHHALRRRWSWRSGRAPCPPWCGTGGRSPARGSNVPMAPFGSALTAASAHGAGLHVHAVAAFLERVFVAVDLLRDVHDRARRLPIGIVVRRVERQRRAEARQRRIGLERGLEAVPGVDFGQDRRRRAAWGPRPALPARRPTNPAPRADTTRATTPGR